MNDYYISKSCVTSAESAGSCLSMLNSFNFQLLNFCLLYLHLSSPRPSLSGLLCDLLWSDPDKDVQGWGENDRGVSFTFGADVVSKFLNRHDLDLICRAHQVIVEVCGKQIHLVGLFFCLFFCGDLKLIGHAL